VAGSSPRPRSRSHRTALPRTGERKSGGASGRHARADRRLFVRRCGSGMLRPGIIDDEVAAQALEAIDVPGAGRRAARQHRDPANGAVLWPGRAGRAQALVIRCAAGQPSSRPADRIMERIMELMLVVRSLIQIKAPGRPTIRHSCLYLPTDLSSARRPDSHPHISARTNVEPARLCGDPEPNDILHLAVSRGSQPFRRAGASLSAPRALLIARAQSAGRRVGKSSASRTTGEPE
jgi:hypothetical protein